MRTALRCLLAAALVVGASGAAPTAPKSAVLEVMEQEMHRSVEGFKAKADPAPYFLSYFVSERGGFAMSASQGALRHRGKGRTRLLDVEARVGDQQLDNTRQLRGERSFGNRGFSRPVHLPLEDDVAALRTALWLETDRKYKEAVEAYIQVKTNAAVKTKEEDESADFSREKPERYIGPAMKPPAVDEAAWEKTLKEVSRVFAAEPLIYDSDVSLSVDSMTTDLVTSEGSAVSESHVHARVGLLAQTRAEDGMMLYRYEAFDAHALERLPGASRLSETAARIVKDLLALRSAPTIEPYTGPAILSGRAAGVFFHEIFGHRIEGHRQKGDQEGQTFTKKVNQAVLPDFLSVSDDPTQERAGDTDLNGYYLYDDEGVKSRRVAVVEKGVLKNFLMSRSPAAGFDQSNGHGRKAAGLRAVGRQGNLIVESSAGVSEEKLRDLLREECRKQGKPFGLFFADISGGFTFTGRGIPQAYQVSPVMVYRVFTDGRPDELVRGADLIGTPLVSFSKILASGERAEAFNGICGAESGFVPVAAVSPSILTAQIEIQKRAKAADRPPVLPPPSRGLP